MCLPFLEVERIETRTMRVTPYCRTCIVRTQAEKRQIRSIFWACIWLLHALPAIRVLVLTGTEEETARR